MKHKLMYLLIIACVLPGCTVTQKPTKGKDNIQVKNTKKIQDKSSSMNTSKKNQKKVSVSNSSKMIQKNDIKDKVETKAIALINENQPVLSKTNDLNSKDWIEDRNTLIECEKNSNCMKELLVINNQMILKVNITPESYNLVKNKDNLITYFNNDVKIFKTQPDVYLKKYGIFNTKVKTNYQDMLLSLPEVQITDMFFPKVYARFEPFS